MLQVSSETALEIYDAKALCFFTNTFVFVRIFQGRKERMTSSQHGAYDLGHTHPTMAKNNGMQSSNAKQISFKFRLSSD